MPLSRLLLIVLVETSINTNIHINLKNNETVMNTIQIFYLLSADIFR